MNTEATGHTSLRDFLHVIFKRRNHILLFFFVTVCTVAIGSLVVKPTYEATSQILVKIGRENLYVPPSGSATPVVSFNREEQINSEIEILQSRFLAEKVVKSLGPTVIYKDLNENSDGFLSGLFRRAHPPQTPVDKAVLELQKALKVEGVRKSDVIDVSFKHKDPQMAATVVNTLVSFYLDRHLHVHKNPQAYDFFQEQSQILRNKLNEAEEKLERFKKKHAVSSLDEERSLLLKQEADLVTGLNQTLSQEAETENRISQLRQQLAATSKTILLDQEIDHNPFAINTLEARLVELELKEQELLSKYTEQSRLVRNVREEIWMVRNKLAEQEAKRYGKSRSGVNITYQRLQEELLRNEAELKAIRAKKETQTAHLSKHRRQLEKLNRIEVELNQLKQQVDVDRENYRLYLSKFEESRISDAMDTEKIANVNVIEPAQPPLKPVSPRILLNILLAIFLGGFGGLGLAFFSEYLDDSLEKDEDVEEYLQLPVLGSTPDVTGYWATTSSPEWTPSLRATLSHPRFALLVSLVLATCSLLGLIVLLGNWPPNQDGKQPLPLQRALQSERPKHADNTDKPAVSAPPVGYTQLSVFPMPSAQKKGDIKLPQAASLKQQPDNKTAHMGIPAPDLKTRASKAGKVVIQIGAFRQTAKAERLTKKLQEKGYDAYVEERILKNWGLLYLVRVQGYTTVSAAETEMVRLKKQGLHDAFIASQR